MSAPTTLSRQFYDINSGSLDTVKDPGDAGTIRVSNKGFYRVEIESAGVETRALEAATALPVFTEATLAFKTKGGNVTVTAGSHVIVLDTIGQVVTFIVVPTSGGNVWAIKSNSKVNDASVNLTSAPIALGAVNINTGDATTDTGLIALADALQTLGLITHTWT
jgi:hypothetical protein